jgi:hypothetical protein
MILFNLLTLEQETECNPEKLVKTLELYFNKKTIPKNRFSKFKPIANLQGNSYLLNPKALFDDHYTDIIFKAQYIRLAGRRDYAHYKLYGVTYLDLSYFLDIDINNIKANPLLAITSNTIHFKYEEI